jgi:glycosyltransferase involved in cell wall biosynthesis
MVQELAQSAKKWDSTWTLILHGWKVKRDYLDELKKACDGKHVILSEEVVELEQLDELVSSADIGIALYKPVDRNIYDMAQSSGKIWQYLRCGLPVITVDFPSLQEMMTDGRFGVCVHQPEEMESAIDIILSNYSEYKVRAMNYYKLYGDFSVSFKPILERFQTIHQKDEKDG